MRIPCRLYACTDPGPAFFRSVITPDHAILGPHDSRSLFADFFALIHHKKPPPTGASLQHHFPSSPLAVFFGPSFFSQPPTSLWFDLCPFLSFHGPPPPCTLLGPREKSDVLWFCPFCTLFFAPPQGVSLPLLPFCFFPPLPVEGAPPVVHAPIHRAGEKKWDRQYFLPAGGFSTNPSTWGLFGDCSRALPTPCGLQRTYFPPSLQGGFPALLPHSSATCHPRVPVTGGWVF